MPGRKRRTPPKRPDAHFAEGGGAGRKPETVPVTPVQRICVGLITGAHGVAGDLRIESYCSVPASIGYYGPLFADDGRRRFDIRVRRSGERQLVARVSGVSSREQAEELAGTRLYVDRSVLPSLPDGEFYHADLLGLEVFDTRGSRRGTVVAVQDFGAGDMLEIRLPGGSETALIPFTRETVPGVDLKAGRVLVDPPEGIF